MKKIKILVLLITLCCFTSVFSSNGDTLYVSPNPFDSITVIHFDISQNDTISLNVFNMLGNPVRTYFQNTVLPSGSYSINFYANSLPNGVYLVSLKINSTKTLNKTVVRTSAGINENEIEKLKLILYPNPTKEKFTIETPLVKRASTLTICNINGQELIKQQITENMTEVNISNLKNGVYFVKILTDKAIIVGKIIKE